MVEGYRRRKTIYKNAHKRKVANYYNDYNERDTDIDDLPLKKNNVWIMKALPGIFKQEPEQKPKCPNGHSSQDVVKNGTTTDAMGNIKQRYRCNWCGTTFTGKRADPEKDTVKTKKPEKKSITHNLEDMKEISRLRTELSVQKAQYTETLNLLQKERLKTRNLKAKVKDLETEAFRKKRYLVENPDFLEIT